VDENAKAKAENIEAYFDNLQKRIEFLAALYDMGRVNEALMLRCCYIEALGSRQSPEPERKAKNYCDVLAKHSRNEIWHLVCPKQLKNVMASNGLFKDAIGVVEPLINGFGTQLIEPEQVHARLDPVLSDQQRAWLDDNLFKGTVTYISYERIRSELVHDISAATISFSEMSYKGKPAPDLDFEMLYASLRYIVNVSEARAVSTNKWWFEQ